MIVLAIRGGVTRGSWMFARGRDFPTTTATYPINMFGREETAAKQRGKVRVGDESEGVSEDSSDLDGVPMEVENEAAEEGVSEGIGK